MPPLLGEREKNMEDSKIPQNARVTTSKSLATDKQEQISSLRRRLHNSNRYASGKKRLPRIMSAPLLRTNKKDKLHRRLVEEHYKIDKTNGLLPGVPKYDTDLSRDIHDFFNLIALVSFCPESRPLISYVWYKSADYVYRCLTSYKFFDCHNILGSDRFAQCFELGLG